MSVWLWPEEAPLLEMLFQQDTSMRHGTGPVTFTRSSTGTYIDPTDGLVKTAAIDTPRFERMSDGGIGILLEGSSTNLLTYSAQFDNAAWSNTGVTVTADTTVAPDGATTADSLIETTATNRHRTYQTGITATGNVAYSAYAKNISGTRRLQLRPYGIGSGKAYVDFDLVNGAIITTGGTEYVDSKMEALTDGWYRCIMTANHGGSPTGMQVSISDGSGENPSYTGDGTSGFAIWGAQLEALPFATSYIPTTTATVTRAADLLSIPFSGNAPRFDLSHANPMSFIVDAELYKGNNGVIQQHLFSSTLSHEYLLRVATDASHYMYGGFNDIAAYAPSWIDGQVNRAAFVANPDNTAYGYLNGVSGAQGTITADSTGSATTLYIGAWGTATDPMYGHVRNLRIYDRALTDAEMARMTSGDAPVIPDDTAVRLYPGWDYAREDRKVEDVHRVRSGRQFRYKWGEFARRKFSLEDVSSSDTALVNSWWSTNTALLFTQDSGTTVSSVFLVNKALPLGAYQKPYDDLFRGNIELETY